MNPVTIRRAIPADAAVLAEIAARTFAETFETENTPEDLAAHLQSAYGVAQQSAELADPDVVTLLATMDSGLVGYAQVRRKPPACVTGQSPVELHRFYVVRAAQGRGVAAPLMLAARQAAVEMGGQHLWLGVWERNPRAVAFYLKSGFARVGSHVFVVGSDPQTDWVFVSALPHGESRTERAEAPVPDVCIALHAPAPGDVLAVVSAGLGEYNAAAGAMQRDVHPLHAIASDGVGVVLGGAVGRTWGACCELQQLWVSADARGKGTGSMLLAAFESEARSRGCELVCLDTFSFQAPVFYRDRGYVEVLRTSGYTGGVVKHTLHKRLTGHNAPG